MKRAPTRTIARLSQVARPLHVPGAFGVVIDTREQLPYDLRGVPVEVRALSSGDYSVIGYESKIAIERKSEEDFVRSVSSDAVRFFEEIDRLRAYDFAAIVVESTLERIAAKVYSAHSYEAQKIDPKDVINRAAAITVRGVPVFWCGTSRRIAAGYTLRLLKFWWQRRRDAERAETFALTPSGGGAGE